MNQAATAYARQPPRLEISTIAPSAAFATSSWKLLPVIHGFVSATGNAALQVQNLTLEALIIEKLYASFAHTEQRKRCKVNLRLRFRTVKEGDCLRR
jgi:hypothetical protein